MTQTPGIPDNSISQQIEDLCREITAREEAGEPEAGAWFDDVLESDVLATRASGEFQEKRKFIRELKNGASRGRVTKPSMTILYGRSVAVAWALTVIGSRRYRSQRIFRQSSGPTPRKAGWMLEVWKTTMLQTPPSAGPETDVHKPEPSSGPPGARGIGSHLI